MEKGHCFSWRGFMLDSARHFMPPENIRKLILAARICGMNRMHWHLTDDQGWRIEIRKYPQLTKTGAVRGRSFFGGVSETENNCGFYSQEEIREIVRFAGENGMEVIPEIEMPGHASALLAACPEYGCRRLSAGADGKIREARPWPYAVGISGGIFPNLVCAGKESAVRFLKDILDEVTELFPGRMIHIGGDEALKLQWRRCPDCQARMRSHGLRSEDELQRELMLEIGAYLAEKGWETIVWNDVLSGGMLPPYFIVQQWMSGEEATRQFLRQGGRVICSDNRALYFDYPYGRTDVRKIWRYPRIPHWAEGYEAQLLGWECPLWTERVTNLERASFLLFPRLAAAGLKAYQENADLPWEAFREQVSEKQREIRKLGLNCAAEEWWDMPEDQANADRQAEENRIHAPEAQPFNRKIRQLVLLDQTERLMGQLGMPDAFILQAGDQVLAKVYGWEPAGNGAACEGNGLHAAVRPEADSPEWIRRLPAAQEAGQLLVVAGTGMNQSTAWISMHRKKENGRWKQQLSTPGFVGRNGLCPETEHQEGCAATPAGVYHIGKAFGIAPDPGCALPYTQVDEHLYWSGDTACRYNQMADIREVPGLSVKDSEHLADYTEEYQYCLDIGFNPEGVPGRGSAIFLHCFGERKPWTAGCIAVPEETMKLILQSVRKGCTVVIDTLEHLGGTLS